MKKIEKSSQGRVLEKVAVDYDRYPEEIQHAASYHAANYYREKYHQSRNKNIAFMALFSIMALFSVSGYAHTFSHVGKSYDVETQGAVTTLYKSTDSDGDTTCSIEVSYDVDGNEYHTSTLVSSSGLCSYTEGSQAPVRYNEASPQNGFIYIEKDLFVYLIFGLLAIGIPSLITAFIIRQKKRSLAQLEELTSEPPTVDNGTNETIRLDVEKRVDTYYKILHTRTSKQRSQ